MLFMNEVVFKHKIMDYNRNIHNKFTNMLNEHYKPFGITSVQAVILLDLYENGEEKISDLSKNLSMTNSNVSVICQRLEKNGFINRVRDSEDQRIVKVVLAEKFMDIQTKLESSVFDNYFENLTDDKIQDMKDIVSGLEKLDKLLSCIECK
jgi:DNA-binding MarR family transcriptional regulator